MTVPVDLVDPTLLKDPVEEFFRQGGIDVPIEESDDKISAKKVAMVGTALAASFLVYRMLMHKELDEAIAPSTKGEALKLIDRTFSRIAPVWARAALPAAVAAYRMGAYDATTISADELETLAQAYVKTLGEYINSTSAEAMADGFQAQLNARWSPELAWSRSVAGYGLDGPQTRSYVSSFTQGVKDGYIADPVPRASVKLVQTGLGMRAKRFGDTESWSAIQTGRNVIWMAQAAAGDLPEGTKKRWITAHDERVCPVCGPLDQRAILLTHKFHAEGKKFYAPGVHPNCRCRLELVYPDGYINRVEELIRKSRPGDPYNRDSDGQFARKESRGWTYREAMDDGEKHTTAPRRMRLRTLEAEKPAAQQQTITDSDHESAFGDDTESVFGSGGHESSFGGGSAFAPAVRRVRASQALKEGAVTTVYYTVDMGTGDNTPVDPPKDPPPNADEYGEPIGRTVISQQSMIDGNFKKVGAGVTTYPSPGDVIDFKGGVDIIWDPDVQVSIARHKEEGRIEQWKDIVERANLFSAAEAIFDYDVDLDNLSPAEEEAIDDYLAQGRLKGSEDTRYEISNDMIVYEIEDARGLPIDPETLHKRVLGKYYVVSADYIEDPHAFGFGPDAVVVKAVLEPWTGQTE